MNIRELTSDKHKQAESTPFMKAVFEKRLPFSLWMDWTFQKTLFYNTIENAASSLCLLEDLPDIRRAFYLYLDCRDHITLKSKFLKSSIDYHNYLLDISKDPDKIMAHLYTWHMGDLSGGQMIKKIIGKQKSLEFNNPDILKANIQNKLKENMVDEINNSFDWAIKILKEYDGRLESN